MGDARTLTATRSALPLLAGTRVWQAVRTSPFFRIWPATALLFALSPLIASGSVNGSALRGMLPFAAIVAIASVGQTLVVQQAGLDLSVPGVVSLSTIVVTQYPNGDAGKLPVAILIVLGASATAGLISGVAVTRFRITAIVATLGVNALLIGVVLKLTNGNSPGTVPDQLSRFAVDESVGVPNTVWTALAIVLVVAVVAKKSVVGRRFMLVGENSRAAAAAAIPVKRYRVGAYVVAAITYGVAGILLAGFLQAPGLFAGDQYLFPTIVAVVLGGTSLAGGNGSVVATAVGALFLTQLQQVVFGAAGAKPSSQYLIQGGIIALGMAFRKISPTNLLHRALARVRPVSNEGRNDHDAARTSETMPTTVATK